ncbi:hypothetical protein [Salinibacterium sp. ZJ450]|uniref:hypothetical protein n=1 Tax=Salinibacterium sp. ZJ450 TaxID=2708338 RepID=UPI0014239DEB|nr:hypothetical protein [Salinibacterium sp. ZJ450]
MLRVATALLAAFGILGATTAAATAAQPVSPAIALVAPTAGTDAPTWGVQPGGVGGPDGRQAFDFTVAPGSVVSDLVSISNFTPSPVTFAVYPADGINDTETGAFTLSSGPTDNTDAGSWVTVQSDAADTACADPATAPAACLAVQEGAIALTLPGNSRAEVPIQISVPTNASPGDHAAGIVAAVSQRSENAEGQPIIVEQRVGARIYLRVDGELTPGLTVAGLVSEYTPALNPFDGTLRVEYQLTNSGNVRVHAGQRVSVTGPFGIPLASVEAGRVEDLVPGQSVHVPLEFTGIPALLFAVATVDVVPQLAGEATPTEVVSQSATGWAIPWTLLLALLLIAGGIWFGLRWRRRYRVRLAATVEHAVQQAQRTQAAAHSSETAERETV